MRIGKIRRVGGGCLLLDLKEERVAGPVAFEVNAVIAQAQRAGTDDFESDVNRTVERQQMLALWLKSLAVGGERVDDLFGLTSGDAGEAGLYLLETARAGFSWDGLGELVEIVKRSGALGFQQSLVNWLDVGDAMDLEASDFKERKTCKGAHVFAVTSDAVLDGIVSRGFFVTGLAAGENDGGGHAFEVPLERAANRFVEVIDVEDEPAVGCGEGAKIAHVGVAAYLSFDSGIGQ